MKDKSIVIVFPEGTVDVGGEIYRCLTQKPANLRVLRWSPGCDPAGYSECNDGSGGGFANFGIIEPWLEPWRSAKKQADAAKVAKDAAQERQKEIAEQERKAVEAEQKRLESKREDSEAYHRAMDGLWSTDHEVIKAMEKRLYDMGALSDEFVAKREVWRKQAKASREKLRRET